MDKILKNILIEYENLIIKDPLNRFKKQDRINKTIKVIISKFAEFHKEQEIKNTYKYKFDNTKRRYERKKILIDEYCKKLKELAELNSELYNMTELYENEFMLDYDHELFTIFKNKIGYYTRLHNKIREIT